MAEALTQQVANVTSFLSDADVLRWSGALTHSASTLYDRALDAEELRRHLGQGLHPLASKQALRGAWRKLLRADAPELLSAGLGAVGLVFVLQRGEQEQLSELLGSMGITAVLSANPLLGLCVVATTGYAYWQAKAGGAGPAVDRLSAARGAALAGSSAAVFGVMAGPVVLKMVVAIAVTGAVRKLTARAVVKAPIPSSRSRSLQPFESQPLSPRQLSPEPAASVVHRSFRSDRDLVEAMLL
jgi:hypothetical protein